jgi:hypothetical protein
LFSSLFPFLFRETVFPSSEITKITDVFQN